MDRAKMFDQSVVHRTKTVGGVFISAKTAQESRASFLNSKK